MLGKIATIAAVAAGGMMISKQLRKARNAEKTTIEESVEVNVPVSTAYNQWTQFEDFPKFMKGVREVRQLDDTHLHWRARISGSPGAVPAALKTRALSLSTKSPIQPPASCCRWITVRRDSWKVLAMR